MVVDGSRSIETSCLPGKLKLWRSAMWSTTMIVVIPDNSMMCLFQRKRSQREWLILRLGSGYETHTTSAVWPCNQKRFWRPFKTSLTEEFKCAKARLEMMLSESRDIAVCSTSPAVSAGRKWNPRETILQAHAALRHRDTADQVQHGGWGV